MAFKLNRAGSLDTGKQLGKAFVRGAAIPKTGKQIGKAFVAGARGAAVGGLGKSVGGALKKQAATIKKYIK